MALDHAAYLAACRSRDIPEHCQCRWEWHGRLHRYVRHATADPCPWHGIHATDDPVVTAKRRKALLEAS